MSATGTTLENAPVLRGILSWVITMILPVALVLTAVRLIANPAFVRFEYNTPGFPPDPYGFTKEDRIHWLQFSLNYLSNDQGIEYLGDLRFENGQPVYNPGELRHMADVKNVFQTALKVWYASLALLAIGGIVAFFTHTGEAYRQGLSRGGFLTVLLLGTVTLLALLVFGPVLQTFHETFFQSGTYTFFYSDTLIRLTPERFWRDTFIAVGVIAGGLGLALWYFFKKTY